MIENSRYYWSHLKTKTVTVRVAPRRQSCGLVFRISGMVDLGNGRQTVMLQHVDYPNTYHRRNVSKDIPVPFSMGKLDFIYTSCNQPKVQNVNSLLSYIYKNDDVEKIVEEVLSPGDILVFKQDASSLKIKLVETLRIVKENTYTKTKAKHAL